MKTKMFFSLLAVALLSIHAVYAGEKEVSEDVRTQIVQAMKEVSFSDEGSVNIYLDIDNTKNVTVYRVEGNDSELVSEVKSKLRAFKFDYASDVTGKYKIKVKFVDALTASTNDLVPSN